jgi:hypothetical protein
MKTIIPSVPSLLLLLLLASCSNSNKKNIVSTNFDDLRSWNVGNDAFSDKTARSDKYSIFTSAEKEFSLTYETTLETLKSKGYSRLKASIWAKPSTVSKDAQWVAAINSPTGANYVWKSSFISAGQETDEKGWKKVTIELDLPDNAPDGIVKIYGWSPSKEEIFLDDFELAFE